jgi:uncharacterized protein YjdB
MKKIKHRTKVISTRLILIIVLYGALFFGACSEQEETAERRETAIRTISVTPANVILAVGEIRAAKAVVTPDGANQEIYWRSDDIGIATVANGIISGIAEGKTVITVTSVANAEKHDQITVHVVKAMTAVESISFDTTETVEMYIGDKMPLKVTFTPPDVANKEILWQNTNPSAAIIKNDTVQALEIGQTVITALAGANVNKTVSVEISVTDRSEPVEK